MTPATTPTTPRLRLAAPDGTRRGGLWDEPLFPRGVRRLASTIRNRGAARAAAGII
jgi:hypothetical protein